MYLEYQKLLAEDPGLVARLDMMPGSLFSGRKRLAKGAVGVFFCYSLPALEPGKGEFSLEAGPTRWYLYDTDQEEIIEEAGRIIASIRSRPRTPRRCNTDEKLLKDIRREVQNHIRNTYLKQVQAPLNAPKPELVCWMELNR